MSRNYYIFKIGRTHEYPSKKHLMFESKATGTKLLAVKMCTDNSFLIVVVAAN